MYWISGGRTPEQLRLLPLFFFLSFITELSFPLNVLPEAGDPGGGGACAYSLGVM